MPRRHWLRIKLGHPHTAHTRSRHYREARPIGQGPRFHEPVRGVVHGPCRPRLGHRVGAHVELFAANRVVLLPTGIGVRHPTAHRDGRIIRARCYGDFVTLDPTGVVLIRAGSRPSLADLFSAWGQPLSRTQLTAFSAGTGQSVRMYVDGRRRAAPPAAVRLNATPRSCSRSAPTCHHTIGSRFRRAPKS